MERILERLIFGEEQKQGLKGLALIPAPTGFGKTYVTCDFIARNIERLIEQDIKIIFVTPLLKNLPIDTLKQAFERYGKGEQFDEYFLRLPSRYDSFNDTFNKQLDYIKSAMPGELKKSAGFKNVANLLHQSKPQHANASNNQAWSKLYDLDKRFREVETEFRRELKREVFRGSRTKSEKKKILNQPDNQWVYRLYPEALFDDKPIVMMSMTKFLMPFSTLVESAYPLVEKLKAGTVVFMDEVDACKQDIQNVIIERGLDHHYDPIHLLKSSYKHLKTHSHPSFFLKDSPKRKNKMAEKGWQSIQDTIDFLTSRMEEVYQRFELGFQLKTEQSEHSRQFLFSDYRTIQVAQKILDVTTDQQQGVNWIKHHQNLEVPDYQLNALLGGVQSVNKMLKRNISNVAKNYLENKNLDRAENQDEMLREQALNTVMSEYGIEQSNRFRQSFFDARLQYATNIRFKPPLDEDFSGFCAQGFSLFEMSDSPNHDTYSALKHYVFTDTPENYLAYLCDKARVIGLSATAEFENPLGNFYFNYLHQQLGDKFIWLNDAEHARIQDEFDQRTQGYANIKLDVGVLKNASDFEQELLDVLDDSEMVEQLIAEINAFILETQKPDYFLQRYLNLFNTMQQFIEAEDMYGFLALFTALPKPDNPAFDLAWVERVFRHLAKDKNKEIPGLVLKVLQSQNYADDLAKVTKLLSEGKRVFVVSSYATLGAGQNLQFPIPDTLKNSVITINDSNPSTEMDFNGLYLDNVTRVIPNPKENDEGYQLKNALDRIFKLMYLHEVGALSTDQKDELVKHSLQVLYASKAFNPIGLKELQAHHNAVAAKLIQAIGRLCRTNQKAPRIFIRLSETLLKSLHQADLPATTPLLPEVKAILALQPSQSVQASANQQLITQAENRNEKVELYIARMLGNITSPNHIKTWRALRAYCLAHPCFDEWTDEYHSDLHLQLPQAQAKYWYKPKDANLKEVDISDRYQSDYRDTSDLSRALERMMKLPGLVDYFEKKGWETKHAKSKYWLVPVLWQNIYQGALGEEIGRFVFEQCLSYPLYDLTDDYHELFDFKLKEGVYIDFKFWLNYRDEATAYRAKIREKMQRIGASKVLVINVYGDEPAQPINMGTDIIEIPGLVVQGELNSHAKQTITKAYQEGEEYDQRKN
ncbi:DEAD/DEAH box helicase family protein [Thiomicrospira microaerophila]|uniref:hypothetical protein n=1 Tax=Thiomicrospira microaerophila TaxID=406020 RepID=UPI0005C8F445|nr:hypothetical protein [Thiomicrospira microaerophila]